MSIELPEAKIFADQMNREIVGKRIRAYQLKDWERLQKIGFINRDLKAFDQLVNKNVLSIASRGNVIIAKFDGEVNLLLCPEYGGEIFFFPKGKAALETFHLKLDFSDGSTLTVRLTSMGGIYTLKNGELSSSYVFKRDFNPKMLSPIDKEFKFETLSKLLAGNNRALKSVLVGKDAVVVGLSNSAFQDILYRAKLHPKRKASELNVEEKRALYDAIKLVLSERLRLKGKDQFLDLYGKRGAYTPAMGPNMKHQKCPTCGTYIEKLNIGGGQVYLCPKCQK
jgi:formamidopyrimidine-DNA glycosylase